MTSPLLSRRNFLAAASLVPALAAAPARAQGAAPAWPARPVRLLIPFPAGGATDYAARTIGQALSERWRQPVVCENRVGAGSTIGTEAGARSAPDGYTLVMGIPAGITIAPHIYPKLGYNPLTDLVPIAGFATSPLVLVVPTDSPLHSVKDVLAAARAEPGKLSYASNGSGSLPHLTTEWFASQARIRLTHVPYRGSAQALPDLVAGRTTMMMDIIVSALPLVEGGRLRVLAVTGAQPTSRLPGVPTIASSGFPGFASDQWYALFAPAGTPATIVQKIDEDVRSVTEAPALRGQMWQRGAEIQYTGGRAFGQAVQRDWQRWQQVARATGAHAE